MKEIKIWKIITLNIITLGLYLLFWVVNRRQEMIDNYHRKIPHWWWYVGSVLLSLAVVGVLTWSSHFTETYSQARVFTVLLICLLPVLGGVAVVHLWWVWKFSQASAFVTDGRMSTGWAFALYVLGGQLVTPFLQYYFNQAAELKALNKKPHHSPSKKLQIWASAAIALLLLVSTVITFAMPEPTYSEPKEQIKYYDKESERLLDDHANCVRQLEKDYPKVTELNEEAYSQAYDNCEVIRLEASKAVLKYNELIR